MTRLVALVGLVLASRLPFVSAGYGLDPDALRVVNTARLIRATGTYASSRHPGYPVQEYLVSWLLPGGVWAVNGMSACMGCACCVFLALCLQELAVPRALLLALSLAFVPVVYINSTCAMDYIWALAFILAAAWLSLRQRPWFAGVCLGLAIGTRITSGAMLIPLWLLTLSRASERGALRACARLTVATLAVGAVCFVPVYRRYGLRAFTYSQALGSGTLVAIVRRATLSVWGSFGCCLMAAAVAYILVTIFWADRSIRTRRRYWASAACFAAITLYAVAYWKLPHEAGYLIPVVPFSIWLVAMWMPRQPSVVLAAGLCLSPFVEFRDGKLGPGRIIIDHSQRTKLDERIGKIVAAAQRLEQPVVLIAGYRLPAVEAALGDARSDQRRWLYLMKSQEQLNRYRDKGYKIYVVDRATEVYQRRVNGLKLRSLGVKRLRLE